MPSAQLAALLNRKLGSVYQMATHLGVCKSPAFLSGQHSGRITNGNKPWNAGQPFEAGGRSAQTRFALGQAPHNVRPIGSLRISGENILERKLNNNKGPNHVRWIPVSRIVWEAAHGKVPPKHLVIFKPGMRTTELDQITLDKLECISRAEHAKRNNAWKNGSEIGKLYQLKGAITRQLNRIKKQTKEQQS
jgi:hypothetical protein